MSLTHVKPVSWAKSAAPAEVNSHPHLPVFRLSDCRVTFDWLLHGQPLQICIVSSERVISSKSFSPPKVLSCNFTRSRQHISSIIQVGLLLCCRCEALVAKIMTSGPMTLLLSAICANLVPFSPSHHKLLFIFKLTQAYESHRGNEYSDYVMPVVVSTLARDLTLC